MNIVIRKVNLTDSKLFDIIEKIKLITKVETEAIYTNLNLKSTKCETPEDLI